VSDVNDVSDVSDVNDMVICERCERCERCEPCALGERCYSSDDSVVRLTRESTKMKR